MKFIVFVLMVSGVFLLAFGRLNSDVTADLAENLSSYLDENESIPGNFVSQQAPELLAETVASAMDKLEPITVATNHEVTTATSQTPEQEKNGLEIQAPDASETRIEEVLTQGIEYSRSQLSETTVHPAAPAPLKGDARGHASAATLREIHSLNSEALSSLSRVDAVLHSKKKGSKQ